jgi:hypothetical protein
MNRPNKLPAVDAAMTLLFRVAHHWCGTTEAERWADSLAVNRIAAISLVCYKRVGTITEQVFASVNSDYTIVDGAPVNARPRG